MKKSFKAFSVVFIALFTIFSAVSCVLGTSFLEDSIEQIGTDKYALVASNGDDIFGLKLTDNEFNFELVQLDPTVYLPLEDKKVNIGNLKPTSLVIDDEYVYISSMCKDGAGRNKVLIYDKNDLKSVNQIGGSWTITDGIYHPAGVGADKNNIYIVSGKTNVVRVYKKSTVKANWGKMNGNIKADAYLKLPATIPHDKNATATVYGYNNSLIISYVYDDGSAKKGSAIYKFNTTFVTSKKYTEWNSGMEPAEVVPIPFNKTILTAIGTSNGYAALQLGDKIVVLDEARLKKADFSDYSFSLASDPTELSIISTALNEKFVAYTCEKGSTIKKTVLKPYDVSTAKLGATLTEVNDVALLASKDEMFKEGDTMEVKSQYRIRLKKPIVDTLENGKLELRSFYMKDLVGAKYAIQVKGMSDEIIVLNLTESLRPFDVKTYNMPILKDGGVFKTVKGRTVEVTKLNPNDILSSRIIHNDKSYETITNLGADWTVSFSGGDAEDARYIAVMREDAKNYLYTYTNMAYAFTSSVMDDCLNRFTYLTRSIFIEDVKGMSDSTQTAWYHLDKSDKYYNSADKKRFLDRVGATDKWISHWGLSIDTEQVGVASGGGTGGGGWIAVVRGAFNQSGEDVVTYIVAHEFGHSRNWQHGSSFAYGAFSDRSNNQRKDYITDMLPNICKTLLHMGVLPYMDQFDPKNYDYMALDQIESKVYLSGKPLWWSSELWKHVQKKVKAINDYANEIDSGRNAERKLITSQMDELQAHLDAFVAKKGQPIKNKGNYESWRTEIQADSKFSWITNHQWNRMNQTYGGNDPVGTIRNEALKSIEGNFDKTPLLNKWGFSNDTSFTILENIVCKHPGHKYSAKVFKDQ